MARRSRRAGSGSWWLTSHRYTRATRPVMPDRSEDTTRTSISRRCTGCWPGSCSALDGTCYCDAGSRPSRLEYSRGVRICVDSRWGTLASAVESRAFDLLEVVVVGELGHEARTVRRLEMLC